MMFYDPIMICQVKLSGVPAIQEVGPEQEAGGSHQEATPQHLQPPLLVTEDAVEASLRHMWSLVFSREEAVREAVVDAMYNLYLKDTPGTVDIMMCHHEAICLVTLPEIRSA
jgi:hypothetical protein